jgi:hypothetical protein
MNAWADEMSISPTTPPDRSVLAGRIPAPPATPTSSKTVQARPTPFSIDRPVADFDQNKRD